MARKNFYGKGDARLEEVGEGEVDSKSASEDTNASTLTPFTDTDKNKRKRKLKEMLREQHKEKVSKQKKKRLNKYIEHQLKREEKQILLKKLEGTRIDSSILRSAKLIGTGKETKRERLEDALKKEKEGKADESVKELLYEEKPVKSWAEAVEEEEPPSQIIDHRPKAAFTGGFGFSNLPKVAKKTKKGKYTWRARVEAEEAEKRKREEEDDFAESSESESDSDSEVVEEDEDEDVAESSESDSEEVEDDVEESEETPRSKDFKEWANQQVRKMEGITAVEVQPAPADYKPLVRAEDLEDGLTTEDDLTPLNENVHRKIYTVEVKRPDDIQAARVQLPVYGEEYKIMNAIHNNDCVIISGETGSGKTTQVPQFLFESGYGSPDSETPGMIAITEPRRVAAVSMASRVGSELGDCGDRVGYQIRFDGNVKPNTAVKFMTDGVLLREMMSDFLLSRYSAIIIDEAHERSINTDILLGMLSRVLKLRRQYHDKNPVKYKVLKLIIMSATLRVKDFVESQLFKVPPPVLKVEARQYPVSIHFNKRSAFNYVEEAFQKTCKIHRQLPKGGILIFLTGKAEIDDMVRRLRARFPLKKKLGSYAEVADVQVSAHNVDLEPEEVEFDAGEMEIKEEDDFDEAENSDDDEGFEESLEEDQTPDDPLYVLPLYSLLPTKEQMKVFEDPPAGSRMCVVATNVAETSLTIPGVRYVVDSGRSKDRKYNEETGLQSFEVGWISKAAADQRSGRAGRTGPGHCYRLFSSALYDSEFAQFSKPEILRMPVESVVLTMKSMGIDTIMNFPFPTPPSRPMLKRAEKLLRYLGALDDSEKITALGKQMSMLPTSPRFSKMLLVGNQEKCLPYVVALVSGFSVGDPFLTEYDLGVAVSEVKTEYDENVPSQEEVEKKRRLLSKFGKSRKMFGRLDKSSDSLRLLFAICSSDHVPADSREAFFRNNFLNMKIMTEIRKLRKQLSYIIRVSTTTDSVAASRVTDSELKLDMPSKRQVQALKQIVAAGYIDQVAVRADVVDKELKVSNNTSISDIPYLTPAPPLQGAGREQEQANRFVYIHPASILVHSGELPPNYLVYHTLQISSNTKSTKIRIKPLNDIKAKALANVGKHSGLVTYSKPLGHPYAPKEISPTERECYVVPRYGANIGTGGVGWDLVAIKVQQKKEHGVWKTV